VVQASNFFITVSNVAVFSSLQSIMETFPVLNLAQIKHFMDMYTDKYVLFF
jgi:hypothetical protein